MVKILQGIFFLISFVFCSFHLNAQAIEYKDWPIEKAIETAQKEYKLIFVDVYATWCGSCKKMDKLTYTQPEVAEFINENFIALHYNYEKGHGKEFVAKYTVDRWPSIFVLTPKGKVLNKSTGYIPAEDFLTLLKIMHRNNYKKPKVENE